MKKKIKKQKQKKDKEMFKNRTQHFLSGSNICPLLHLCAEKI